MNPIAGKLLSTSHALTQSIINQLEEAGISRNNIVIWDRREADLKESGFTRRITPDIRIIGTEYTDENGSYINAEGKFYGEERIDKEHYYFVDLEGEYDAYTMPFMINGGKYSYFTKICTEMVTKNHQRPVLKECGNDDYFLYEEPGFRFYYQYGAASRPNVARHLRFGLCLSSFA